MVGHEGSERHHHHGNRGIFVDMRYLRRTQLVTDEDRKVDRESARQINDDLKRDVGVNRWNVRYYGVVRGADVPDFSILDSNVLRRVPNCKNESYFNYLIFCGIGKNKMKNIDWYILPPN